MDRIREDLLITEVGDEMVIVDPLNHQAHHLNPKAAEAFRVLQNGAFDESCLTADLRYAVQMLERSALLQPRPPFARVGRREALAVLGKASLLPLVVSLALPSPVAALSGGVTEEQCRSGVGCGQPCTDSPIPGRVCGRVEFDADTRCACIPPAVAVCGCDPEF